MNKNFINDFVSGNSKLVQFQLTEINQMISFFHTAKLLGKLMLFKYKSEDIGFEESLPKHQFIVVIEKRYF